MALFLVAPNDRRSRATQYNAVTSNFPTRRGQRGGIAVDRPTEAIGDAMTPGSTQTRLMLQFLSPG